MERESDMCSFQCKKWTLFTFCLLGIISTLIIIIAAAVVLSNADKDPTQSDEEWKHMKKVTIAVIATIGTIAMLVEMLGLIGAIKEHYCLTMTYAILMALITLSSIGGAVRIGSFWFTFVLNVLITVLAFLFARDLHYRQRVRNYS
ncbi:unnamed protein product [Medioppia subpectinata]|uniref:Uncharacterized protein n=1 Tax=Medioppia subpectinata TaxID=1979941 RepID=A0A7R9L363_9ACAR|nr:unnamed protein product [Medioppia subpectinata]CAG2114392.1 unnamed protein product [Medioppia subpectinata]